MLLTSSWILYRKIDSANIQMFAANVRMVFSFPSLLMTRIVAISNIWQVGSQTWIHYLQPVWKQQRSVIFRLVGGWWCESELVSLIIQWIIITWCRMIDNLAVQRSANSQPARLHVGLICKMSNSRLLCDFTCAWGKEVKVLLFFRDENIDVSATIRVAAI